MTLRETTRTVIKLVEDHSGYPVPVQEDPALKTFAKVRMAQVILLLLFTRYFE